MTDLESPRKNNDCYFYYYSTCAKGDSCTFRHEPSALGCETMCSFWKEGKCLNVHCNFRHMELRKNRKAIQCYWEAQPGGCLKPHCPFLHQSSSKPGTPDESLNKCDSGTESADNTMNEKLSHSSLSENSFKNTPVDSLVVNFEEESDNESAPSYSPVKPIVKVKTLEEIKLEKIQAESAAYYSYHPSQEPEESADNLRRRILDRLSTKKRPFALSSLEELGGSATKKIRRELTPDVSEIKIKTLEEIRAERLARQREDENPVYDTSVSSSEDIVPLEENQPQQQQKKLKIKLQRERKMDEHSVQTEPQEVQTELQEVQTEPQEAQTPPSVNNIVVESESDMLQEDISDKNGTSTKILDEVLLLQDDDDNDNVDVKDEDRLLNDDDDFLME